MITYEEIKNNEAINAYIQAADESLIALGLQFKLMINEQQLI